MKVKGMTPEQLVIKSKIELYYQFFNEKVRKTLDKMPKTQATLDVIEQTLLDHASKGSKPNQ